MSAPVNPAPVQQSAYSFLSEDYLQKGGTSAGSLESLRLLGNMTAEVDKWKGKGENYKKLYEKEVQYLDAAIQALNDPKENILKHRFSNDLSGAMALADLMRQEKIAEEVRIRLLSHLPSEIKTEMKATRSAIESVP
jgi:hypothetical protein